jgi:biopolymer transport protein ExbD
MEFEDINITPIMNLFVILIPFLLLSAAFVKLAALDTKLPVAAADSSEEPKLALTLRITKKGYELAVMESRGKKRRASKPKLIKIPKREKAYDYDKLHKHLVMIKKRHPDEFQISMAPDNDTEYDAIIQTMDAVRKLGSSDPEIIRTGTDGKKVKANFLFPDIVFAAISG